MLPTVYILKTKMRRNIIDLCFGNIHASAGGFVIIAARWNYYMKTAVSCRARCLLPPAVGMLSLTVQSFMYLFSLFFQLPFQLSRHSWSLS